jgi:hypothetical protein
MPPTLDVTPGQATYVINRLLAERRLTTSDVQHYLDELHREIATTEQRLTQLRALAPHASTPSNTTRTTSKRDQQEIASNTIASNTIASNTAKRRKRRRFSPATRAQQQLQGRYMGYLRQLPSHLKPRFHAINASHGITAAITALKNHLGK